MTRSFVGLVAILLLPAILSPLGGCAPGTGSPDGSGGGTPLDGGGGGAATRDSDGDGFPDDLERNGIPGSDPFNPDDTPVDPIDTDGDGCSDFDEENFANFCDNDPNTVGSEPAGPDDSNVFSLTVARHVDQPFSENRTDAVLAEASRLLKTVQFDCPDVPTDVTFQRDGPVDTFDIGEAVLTSESQLDALFDLPQDIKIVSSMIGVCGIPSSDDLSVILGCGTDGGSLVIIADADPDVWAHEWGHVQGLGHRDECARNLMHSFELNTNALNDFERNAFLSPTPGARLFLPFSAKGVGHRLETGAGVPLAACPPVLSQCLARLGDEPLDAWLERIAAKRYLAGLPRAAIADVERQFETGAAMADYLLEMLPPRRGLPAGQFEQYRGNIIRMLGFTGQPSACDTLIDCVRSPHGDLTSDQFAAVAEGFLALGRLAQTEERRGATGGQPPPRRGPASAFPGLQFLINGTDVRFWERMGLDWTFGAYEANRLHELLARLSIMALGVSNTDAALTHLRTLRRGGEPISNTYRSGASAHELANEVDEAIARLDRKATFSPRSPGPLRLP